MPNPFTDKCIKCNDKSTDLNFCKKCWTLVLLSENNSSIGKNANKVIEALDKDIISKETFIIKRDRLLHLQKISNDKYLTKLKKEVDKI